MTLGMKQVKGARKGLTFKALVALPFCIVLILQGVMSAAILSGSRVFVQMDDAAYDLFSERVASRASYLEGDMVLRWSDFGSTPDVVADRVDEVLAQRGASVSDIVPGSDVALSIIDAMADDLVSFIRHNEVSGAYFVLANGGAEGEAADARTALYIRDSNPKVNAEGGSDLMVASCPISVGRTMEIALDSQWSATFPLAAEGNQRSAFYYEPLRAAQKHPDAETSDLGYWGRPVDLGWAGTPSVTYSVPIRTASGELCGVLGVEIRLDRIESFFPYRDLNERGDGSYLLTTVQAADSERSAGVEPLPDKPRAYEVLATSGATQSLYVENGSIEAFLDNQARMVVDPAFDSADPDKRAVASAMELALYDSTSPFASDRWVLVGIAPEEGLFSASHALSESLFRSFLVAFVVGLIVAVLVAWLSSSRLRNLMKEVRATGPEEPISFTPTGIVEVDELSDAIESLGTQVASASSRLSQILQLSDRSIGAFEYNAILETVSYTEGLFSTLSILECPEATRFCVGRAGSGTMSADDFDRFMDWYRVRVEREGDDRYLFFDERGTTWVRLVVLMDEDRGVMYGLVEDVTHEIRTRRRLEHERDHDILTGLLNRRAFEQQVTELLRGRKRLGAMLMLDLDNLKFVNDTYGHDWGDQYIKAAARAVESVFGNKGPCSRVSGDEFLAFVDVCSDRADVEALFADLCRAFDESVLVAPDGKALKVRASMGAAFCPDDATAYARLREYADFAMYLAKNSRKGELFTFDRASYDEKSFIVNTGEDLNRLFDEQLVDYHFQPIVDARAGEVIAFEALMRPQLESISTPDRVLALARSQSKLHHVERMTFLGALDAFSQRYVGQGSLLFVNSIATQRLSSEDELFLIERYGGMLRHLVIEIIESDYSREMAVYKEALARRLGARLAVDDFGSGYNGETSLLDYHVDFVKLDACIIRGIDCQKDQQDIARNLVGYAHDRGIRVIAEGVETETELRAVLDLGVDYLQGYLIARPEPHPRDIPDEVKRFIRSCSEGAR
ncbi:EAL domain-containing protein [Paraeggerthella sp.]|uniref:EAL domain-containing protein n=1 Tax=Paraeggerthella sp. TaxID=2897350 RepID=UPI00215D6FC0